MADGTSMTRVRGPRPPTATASRRGSTPCARHAAAPPIRSRRLRHRRQAPAAAGRRSRSAASLRTLLFALLPVALVVGGYVLRHRRPGDVDRQRLCPGRHGRRVDRRRRHRRRDRGAGKPAGQEGRGALPPEAGLLPDRARRRRGAARHGAQPGPDAARRATSSRWRRSPRPRPTFPSTRPNFKRQQDLAQTAPPRRKAAFDQAKHDLDARPAEGRGRQGAGRRHAGPARRRRRSAGRAEPVLSPGQVRRRQRSARPRRHGRQARRSTASSPMSARCRSAPTCTAAQPAFSLVSTDHVWVEASPKETELTYVEPGQTVTVSVDTYPGVEWKGTVDSISPASGSSFSLLPAQNTSGNWVKVVQRIPMRVEHRRPRRQAAAAGRHERRASMSRPATRAACPTSSRELFGSIERATAMTSAASRRCRTGGRQSRRDHGLRDPRRDHAGARHDDRQRRAALYPGQRLGQRRPDQLGADLLHRRGRDHDAALGLPGRPVRPQARAADGRSPASSSPRCCAASRSRCRRSSRFRLLQGLFGAALVPLSQGILLDIYTPEERGSAMALFGVSVMVGPVLGPVIGGWLTDNISWRWVFYINLPIGAAGFRRHRRSSSRETKRDALGQARLVRLRHAQRRDRLAAALPRPRRAARLVLARARSSSRRLICAAAFYIFLVHTFTGRAALRQSAAVPRPQFHASACSSSSSSASPIWPRWR